MSPIPTRSLDEAPLAISRDQIHRDLLEAIVRGELAPGARLLDEELTARFGASRTPIREALQRLAAMGLVVVEPRRATYVAPIDDQQAREALEVVIALSTHVLAATAADLDETERAALADYRDEHVSTADRAAQVMRAGWSDGLWFGVFFRRHGNPVLTRIALQLDPIISRYASQHVAGVDAVALRAARAAVIDAALDGDGAGAAAAMDAYARAIASGDRSPRVRAEIPTASSVRRRLASEVAEEKIRLAVLDGTLVAGEALPERELLEWLAMSRTPVRAALQQLELDGLVDLTPNRQARVSRIDRDLVRDSLEAADVLHAVSARNAVDLAGAARHAEMRRAARAIEETELAGDRQANAAAIVAYSRLLDLAGGNRVLLRTNDRLRPAIQRYLSLRGGDEIVHAATSVFTRVDAAIEARDGAAAAAVFAELPAVRLLRHSSPEDGSGPGAHHGHGRP